MKKFFVLWISQAASLLGSSLVQFALAWYLASTTGKATILAISMLVGVLPQVVLGPFIGPFIDRWDRKRIMIISDLAVAGVTAVLVVLFWANAIQVWHIYAAMFLRSLGGTFHFPAMMASVSLIVPEKHLARASGLNQMVGAAMGVISPMLGALVLAILPMYGVLAIDIGTAAIAVSILAFLSIPKLMRVSDRARWSPLRDMVDGFRFVWSWKGLTLLMTFASLLNLFFNPCFALLPILVSKHFGGGATQLGWLEAGFGIGSIAGGLIMGVWGGSKKRIVTTMLGILAASVTTVAVGFVPQSGIYLCVGILSATGVTLAITNAPISAILQSVVPKDMLGRVSTLVGAMAGAMTPLGLAVAGPVADAMGVRIWYLIAGGVGIAMAGGGFFMPALMNIESQKPAAVTRAVTAGAPQS